MKMKSLVVIVGMAALMSACGDAGMQSEGSSDGPGGPKAPVTKAACADRDECDFYADLVRLDPKGNYLTYILGWEAGSVAPEADFVKSFADKVSLDLTDDIVEDFYQKMTGGQSFTITAENLGVTDLPDVHFVVKADDVTEGSYISFSRVGFNGTKDQAYVMVNHCTIGTTQECDAYPKGQHYKKVNGHWERQAIIQILL